MVMIIMALKIVTKADCWSPEMTMGKKPKKRHRLFPRSRQALSKGTLVNPSIEPGTSGTSRGCKTREFANKKTMNQPWKEQLGEYTEIYWV